MSITYQVTVDEYVTHWRLNDRLHREDGPAVVYTNGDKYWYLNDNLHRIDGPACEWADGSRAWWLNNENLTEAEFNACMNPAKELTLVEIEKLLGYPVKVVK